MLKKIAAGLVLALAAVAAHAQVTVNLSASPTSGTAPLSVTLTWSSNGATSCVAADGWSGNI